MKDFNKHDMIFSLAVLMTTTFINNIRSEEVMRLISSVAGKPAGLLTFDELFTYVYQYLEQKHGSLDCHA